MFVFWNNIHKFAFFLFKFSKEFVSLYFCHKLRAKKNRKINMQLFELIIPQVFALKNARKS